MAAGLEMVVGEGARLAGDGGAAMAGAIVVITERCFAAARHRGCYLIDCTDVLQG